MSTEFKLTISLLETTQEGRPITLYVAEFFIPQTRQKINVSTSTPEATARGVAKLVARALSSET